MKTHQLQWTPKDGGEWRFHSAVEESVGHDQITAAEASPNCSFLYRMVPKDSPDALAPRTETLYAGRMETLPPIFPSGRSAA